MLDGKSNHVTDDRSNTEPAFRPTELMSKVAFIGVGAMGAPMARNLARGGNEVRAFDIDSVALARLKHDGSCIASANPAKAAREAECVITMLPNTSHVLEAAFGADGFATQCPEPLFTSI
jgi:2-hydroxy-3-oxopropionate reductase